jgi:hypothetical protein
MRCVVSECFLSVRSAQSGAVLRGYYEGQQGRHRLRSTVDFLKDKIFEKLYFKARRLKRKLLRPARRRRMREGMTVH